MRNRRLALIALALATALAGSGYVRLRGTDDGTAGALGSDTRQTEPRTSAPSGSSQERVQPRSRPRPGVETLAGRRAGAVTGVEVQKVADCTPGALCPVTVTARFRPASAAQPVTWKVGAARSCEGDITWSPPITVTAQPGWTRVYASSSVPIPQGRAVGLVALTTAPARAQSPPVPITGSSLGC